MTISRSHYELIEQLRGTVSPERLAALEADPIALADYLAAESDTFIRKYHSTKDDTVVYKENADALVPAAAPSPFDDPTFFEDVVHIVAELRREFETGDDILKQRVQELEQQVKDLSERLSIFDRVSDIALKIALQWINKQSST